jgi:hypothetical protein
LKFKVSVSCRYNAWLKKVERLRTYQHIQLLLKVKGRKMAAAMAAALGQS